MKPVILTKHHLALHKFCSNDPTRPQLQNVHVTPDYTEATDGHMVVRVSNPRFDSDEWPSNGTELQPFDGDTILIPADKAKQIAKTAKSKTNALPILDNTAIIANGKAQTYPKGDLDNLTETTATPADCGFPEVDKVFPDPDRECNRIDISIKRLKQLCEALEPFADQQNHRVELEVPDDPETPIMLRITDSASAYHKATALLMPLKQ